MSCGSKASSGAFEPLRSPAVWTIAGALFSLLVWALLVEAGFMPLGLAVVGAAALAVVVNGLTVLGARALTAGRLAAVLEADRVARLLVDDEGVELYRNSRAADLLGEADDPLQALLDRLEDERSREELERLKQVRGVTQRCELSVTGANGAREWYAVAVQPAAEPKGAVLWTVEDISPRRAIDETLRRDHEMLADFVDFLPVGFYSADAEGKFRHVNHRLAEWLGQRPEDLVGRSVEEVLGVLPNPEDDRQEMRLKGRNDEVFQAFVTHSVFDEGGEMFTRSVVVRDLMPERSLERSLKNAERRFRWLFDEAPVGIVLVDPDGTVSASNAAFLALCGRPEEAVAGRAVEDFIAPDDRAALRELLSKVLMGTSPGGHLQVRLGDKAELVASAFISPSAEDGAVSGLILHFVDITEQKNLEIQFAQSQKIQAMGQLAGGVAHDFNNLLTAIIGFCDLLLQRHGPGDPSFSDVMQIKQNSNRAASLVRQLLAFSRRQTLQPKLIDPTDALADLSGLLRRLLGEKIELKMVHGRDLGLVRVDPGQFDQVIINLAVNARDAMKGGGVLTVRTAMERVERPIQRGTELMPAGDYVMIEVRDTGVGISKDHLGRIFEPFFSTKKVGEGTGLGLSTVYGILRQTEGFVFVDSEPGQGACFSIYLPRTEPEAAAQAKAPVVAEPAPAAADLTGAGTVLLVEDEDAVRLFGSRALRNKGYRVLEANCGEDALEVLKAEEQIDVLVTDVVMPGMDGATLARLVRMERPEIRVIMVSGYAEDVALGDVSGEDGVHFLPKPFTLKQLAGKLKEVLEA